MRRSLLTFALALPLVMALAPRRADAQAIYRVARPYEDTVRVVILYNTPEGNCGVLPPVGVQTRDFVVQALDTARVKNTVILPTASTQLSDIQALWQGDTLPHVIVHINAGWGSTNGQYLNAILDWAVENYVGVVSLGDDAAWFAVSVFGFNFVENVPQPMGDARFLDDPDDSLWVTLLPGRDLTANPTQYPYLNGIVRNATQKILYDSTIYFKPVGANGRCQADADEYNVAPGYEPKITFLGYQQGSDGGSRVVNMAADTFHILAAFQDTSASQAIRRGVALSFQPQFLANPSAAEQITYDAIMYASLVHTLRPSVLFLYPSADTSGGPYPPRQTWRAGDTIPLYAHVLDSSDVWHPEFDSLARWELIDSLGNPHLITVSGPYNSFVPTKAWGDVTIRATFSDPDDPSRISTATLTLTILPAAADHLDLLADTSGMDLRNDEPFVELNLTVPGDTATVFAVLRDRFGNYVGPASQADWSGYDHLAVDVYVPGGTGSRAIVTLKDPGEVVINVKSGTLTPDSTGTVILGSGKAAATPNPFVPGVTRADEGLDARAKTFYATALNGSPLGTLIAVSTEQKLAQNGSGTYGKAYIYDAVGNTVRDDISLVKIRQYDYALIWDGTNRSGRHVGGGAYLVQITGRHTNGTSFEHRLKVGVRR